MATRIDTIPPRLASWRSGLERRPLVTALGLGACLGVAGTLCCLAAVAVLLRFLPPELWGNTAARGLDRLGPGVLFLVAVVCAPLVETFLGQLVPIEIAHRIGAHPLACVLLSGVVFACAHYLNGGLAHGITTFVGGSAFACAYVVLRWTGIGPAFLAATTAHAVQNATVIFIIAPLFPGTA